MDDMGFGNQTERAQVPQADPYQYDVAQLPTGRLYYWGIPEPSAQTCGEILTWHKNEPEMFRGRRHDAAESPVPDKDSSYEERSDLSQAGKDYRSNGFRVSPSQILNGN